MDTAIHTELFKELSISLLDSDWLTSLNIDENFIMELIYSNKFINQLDVMIEQNDYSCKSTLLLCEDSLNTLAQNNTFVDWLNYIYQFALSKCFPHTTPTHLIIELNTPCLFYLRILNIISEYQKKSRDDTFQSKYPMEFLTIEEENNLEDSTEYKRFLNGFKSDFLYEIMKLNQETLGYNTLDHICGVHYLALFIGRQLLNAGLPVDLGRVSGAAAGHDIGKYGCKKSEAKRVPYLHYYYSDIWFKKQNINYIRHIAVNHSTWDLELESLPIESLILIYSDFRVKNNFINGKNFMHIFNLNDSFEIILNKLDNLDDAKIKRYKRVYAKLKDFEDYLKFLKIQTNPEISVISINNISRKKKYNYSLLQGVDIIQSIKYLSINHNINLMHELRDESSLNSILEIARSENDWKKLREYLHIFEEYSTYLTQKQKLITIKFLYEQLINPEDDIRRQCAEIIGGLIAMFDEDYRKEVPQDVETLPPEITSSSLLAEYIDLFIFPDHKIIPKHREWIGYSLGIMVSSLFDNCPENAIDNFKKTVLSYYDKNYFHNDSIELYLLEAANYIPGSDSDQDLRPLLDFINAMLNEQNPALRLSAFEVVYNLLPQLNADSFFIKQIKYTLFTDIIKPSNLAIENYLKLKIVKVLNPDVSIIDQFAKFCNNDIENISDIFLNNLKTATDWIVKKNQIELLLQFAINNPKSDGFYTAMHFCNLLKVSAVESVRNRAGEALVKIIPYLSLEQRNDVAVELLRALEIEGYHFTKYIPEYLGKVILFLQPNELDEIIDDLYDKVKSSNSQLVTLLLNTIGVAIENYSSYKANFKESENSFNNRMIKLLGIILNGLVNYDSGVKQVAFSVISTNIFKSKKLNLEKKNHIFKLIAKKMLTLLTDSSEEKLLFLTNSAVLNHIYRFISDYVFFYEKIEFTSSKKIAFFPGAFDPFSLSHKEITKAIRDMGFEVYLQVDEFSWSKQVHPNLIRRNIINMSIADELNIYLYPEDFPTNISNPNDLKILRQNFKTSEVYIVVGSDVIENASSYKSVQIENSIHTFSHIIFARRTGVTKNDSDEAFDNAIKQIKGNIAILSLKPQYEDISSTQIRNYIDDNRDISNLVDPLAQKFIYENSLYRREPQYKTLIQTASIKVEIIEEISEDLICELSHILKINRNYVIECFMDFREKLNSRLILIRDLSQNSKILGFSAFHWIRSNTLFNELRNSMVSEYIRENAVGRIILIDGIFIHDDANYDNLEQIILTETLSFCLAKDYDYAVFKNIIDQYPSEHIYELLRLHGFETLQYSDDDNPVFVVNMDHPSVISLDIEAFIKEPFLSGHVKKTIAKNRKKLQLALTKLYPGHLILAFDRNMIYETMTRKICEENGVSIVQTQPRILGPGMCVPFGNILKRNIIPNTITKSLHTEKFFNPDLKTYKINAYPYYLDLENQIKMIHSFNKPVILVDDLLHKGYRMKALDPLLKKENIKVQKIITGILSGRGKELMDMQNREVDSAYFIPKLRIWFNESALYPFVDGDILWRGTYPQGNLVPSINLILPYSSMTFARGTSKESLYNLSQVCIENSIDIISELEKEYDKLNERNLTLMHLGEVFISPKCPDHGKNMLYDLNLSPTHYLENDMELLKRMEAIIK